MAGINPDRGYSSAAEKPAINHLTAIFFFKESQIKFDR